MSNPMSRRIQFSIRALLVGVVVASVIFAWVANTVHLVQKRKAVLRDWSGRLSIVHSPAYATPKELPWIRRMLGDEPIPALFDNLAEPRGEWVNELHRLFPEAKILVFQTNPLEPDDPFTGSGRSRIPLPVEKFQ